MAPGSVGSRQLAATRVKPLTHCTALEEVPTAHRSGRQFLTKPHLRDVRDGICCRVQTAYCTAERAGIAQSAQRRATLWTAGVHSRQGQQICLSSTASRTALGPTQPPIRCVPGGEADHSPPPTAEVKNG
jgi:hypothetical protein